MMAVRKSVVNKDSQCRNISRNIQALIQNDQLLVENKEAICYNVHPSHRIPQTKHVTAEKIDNIFSMVFCVYPQEPVILPLIITVWVCTIPPLNRYTRNETKFVLKTSIQNSSKVVLLSSPTTKFFLIQQFIPLIHIKKYSSSKRTTHSIRQFFATTFQNSFSCLSW